MLFYVVIALFIIYTDVCMHFVLDIFNYVFSSTCYWSYVIKKLSAIHLKTCERIKQEVNKLVSQTFECKVFSFG